MILSKRGDGFRRRFASGLCAALLLFHAVAYPYSRAKAAAALPMIGYAATVTAFLVACGIYPFQNQSGESFGEWGARRLTELWKTYTEDVYPQSEAAQVISDVKSFYASGGYMVMARDTWERLREFAGWIKDKFSLSGGESDIELGRIVPPQFPALPISDSTGSNGVYYNGLYCGQCKGDVFKIAKYQRYASVKVVIGAYRYGSGYRLECLSDQGFGVWYYASGGVSSATSYSFSQSSGDSTVTAQCLEIYLQTLTSVVESVPVFASKSELERAYLGLSSAGSVFYGISADIGTSVTVPEELAEGAEFGGLSVAGAGAGVDALEDVIESGVMERQKPAVRPVGVEVATGTQVDAETGAVTGDGSVVIDVAGAVPAVSALSPPQAFLDSLATTMTTKFPFCLPFDVMRILSAFVKPPSAPVIRLTFHDPFTDADYTLAVDLAPWDEVAAIVRQLESIILLVGFWLNFDKFNVLNIILGQLG